MKSFFSLAGLAGMTLLGAPALAQMASTPNQLNAVQGATSGLGTSHRFASAAAAASHCPGDTVVWSAGPKLVYHLPETPDYGTGHGFYACKAEADDAGFTAAGS